MSFFQTHLRVLSLVWRANGWRLPAALVLTVLGSSAAPVQIWITAVVIDRVAGAFAAGAAAVDLASLVPPLLVFIVVWSLSQAAAPLQAALNEIMAERTQYEAATVLIDKVVTFDLALFDSGQHMGQLELVTNQNWRLINSVYMSLSWLGALIQLLGVIGVLVTIDVWVVLILVAAVLPRVIIRNAFAKRLFTMYVDNTETIQLSDHVAQLLARPPAAKEVRLFGMGGYLKQLYRDLIAKWLRQQQDLIVRRDLLLTAATSLSVVGTLAAWGLAAVRAIGGTISIGSLAAIFQSVQQISTALDQLFELAGFLLANQPFLRAFFAFVDLRPDQIEGSLRPTGPGQSGRVPPLPVCQGLRFEQVTFKYPESETLILNDISFELRPGESLAIVGENGAGKTTLSKLIARLYDPFTGVVTLDGQDLRDFDPAAYRQQVSAVFQDHVEYHLTAREAIGLGGVADLGNDAQIARAAQLGGADDVLAGLPHGLETMLGKTLKRGVELSGGQWQRLALARAFMREAQILILDEPTAALDALAERDLFQRFAELARGKMTILISHRLASCKMADRILVLEHGKIIETGTHAELMTRAGRYAEMFTAQAQHYQ